MSETTKTLRSLLGPHMNGFYLPELFFHVTEDDLSSIETELTAPYVAETARLRQQIDKLEARWSRVISGDVVPGSLRYQLDQQRAESARLDSEIVDLRRVGNAILQEKIKLAGNCLALQERADALTARVAAADELRATAHDVIRATVNPMSGLLIHQQIHHLQRDVAAYDATATAPAPSAPEEETHDGHLADCAEMDRAPVVPKRIAVSVDLGHSGSEAAEQPEPREIGAPTAPDAAHEVDGGQWWPCPDDEFVDAKIINYVWEVLQRKLSKPEVWIAIGAVRNWDRGGYTPDAPRDHEDEGATMGPGKSPNPTEMHLKILGIEGDVGRLTDVVRTIQDRNVALTACIVALEAKLDGR